MDSEASDLHDHDHDHNNLSEDVDSHPHRRLPIRDLRFEYSYIQSIQPYVELRRGTQGDIAETVVVDDDDSSIDKKEPKPRSSSTSEVIHVKWGKVAWITTRDQIISPLLQGTFWALASYFLTPMSVQVGQRVSAFAHSHLPSKEGRGIGWLRGWVKSLGFGTNMVPRRA